MSRICGIELKPSEAILTVIERNEDNLQFIELEESTVTLLPVNSRSGKMTFVEASLCLYQRRVLDETQDGQHHF